MPNDFFSALSDFLTPERFQRYPELRAKAKSGLIDFWHERIRILERKHGGVAPTNSEAIAEAKAALIKLDNL